MTQRRHEEEHSTYGTYALGFLLSLLLTFAAYVLVQFRLLSGHILVGFLMAIGLLQALVQLILFLHLNKEKKPYSNLHVFLFMLMVIVIIVAGSLWILWSLNYNTMPKM